MPFKSQAQRTLFYAKAERGEIPKETVKRWEEETPKGKKLPEKVKTAEPPPPKGISSHEWDEILQKGSWKYSKMTHIPASKVKHAVAYALSKHANGDEEEENLPSKKVSPELLKEFFKKNPSPPDEQVHELAEEQGTNPHALESQIYAMLGEKLKSAAEADILSGGLADKKKNTNFDPKQMAMGEKVELEHTDTPAVAREIARDHLEEFPTYYTALDEMEKKLEKEKAAAYILGIRFARGQLHV